MPDILIIAGPNGAGKTTFAREYLATERARFEFINADEIARSMLELDVSTLHDIRAGRIMLDRVDELIGANASFVIESTLASLTYARKIPRWRELGNRIWLIYLRLRSVDESIERVQKRVEAGGHNIPMTLSEGALAKVLPILKPSISLSLTRGMSMKVVTSGSFTLHLRKNNERNIGHQSD